MLAITRALDNLLLYGRLAPPILPSASATLPRSPPNPHGHFSTNAGRKDVLLYSDLSTRIEHEVTLSDKDRPSFVQCATDESPVS